MVSDVFDSFPGATNETLLQKFNSMHKEHDFYQVPQRREAAFIIHHYAGTVKYQVCCCFHFVLDLPMLCPRAISGNYSTRQEYK